MLKKILLISSLIAMSPSFALTGTPYVGGSLSVLTNTNDTRSGTSAQGSFRGVPVTLFLGYGAVINQNFSFGGEVFGTPATLSISDNSGTSALRTMYGYGFSLLPALRLSEGTQSFLRLGMQRSRFHTPNGTVFEGNTVTGYHLGLGLQANMSQNWDLRGEYDYTNYRGGSRAVGDEFKLGFVYKIQ